MRYAVIENNVVTNIIEAEERGAESLSSYMTLVKTDNKPVSIGDTYEDNTFYRDGEEVLTPEQEENKMLSEKIVLLEEQITDTQIALCDIYESINGGES